MEARAREESSLYLYLSQKSKLNIVFSYYQKNWLRPGALDSWVVKFKIRQASV